MKFIKNTLFFALIGFALCLTSCEEDCDITCNANEELTDDCNCVEVDGGVSTNITTDVTWTADSIYVLNGRIAVTDGATLTIEPGTIIKGEAGTGVNASALLIARGSKINACGTAALPIIFTSVADQITPEMVASGNYSSPNLTADQSGLWGGLIILGNAPISASTEGGSQLSQVQIEGIPTSDENGLYGGSDATDNSGTLCYVSIRHGGSNIGGGNEINGLTLGGVGSGTSINNIEVVANQDDGIEWFGGTVDASNLLVWACGDDGLDTDQAWNGTVNNWIVAVPAGGSAMELDGPEGDLTQGTNQFNNGVIYCGDNIDHIIDWDDDTNTGVSGLFVYGVSSSYPAEAGFEPIESFGGDMSGNTGNWEYQVADRPVSEIFTGVPTEALTEATVDTRTYGPSASDFSWTFGGHSGTLTDLGL